MRKRKTTNYLNNFDILQEIHKSKVSFCKFSEEQYSIYDVIIPDIEVLVDHSLSESEAYFELPFDEWIDEVIKKKVKKLNRDFDNKPYTVDQYTIDDLVFRVMTFEHIPLDENWPEEKPKKKLSDGFMKVNFPPFQHFTYNNGDPKCVGVTHYDSDGGFNTVHGRLTPKLGNMFMLLVDRIGSKGNWRNYTYLDEMKSSALLQLSQVGLQFNESRGINLNPFAFYTTVINNSFKRVLNNEKKVRNIRDDLLEMAGQSPSFTRQIEATKSVSDKEFFNQWTKTDADARKSPSRLAIMAAAKKRKEAIAEREEAEADGEATEGDAAA